MTSFSTLLRGLALCLPLLIGACMRPEPDTPTVSRLSAPYVEAQHQYRFASGSAALVGGERARIHGFLTGLALRPGDVVVVTIPGSGSASVDAGRRQTMQAALALVPARIRIAQDQSFGPRPSPRSQYGILRVARAQGIRVDCDPGFGDLGCANATNLAVMIHEPGDVLTPQVTGTRTGF
ncbi:hypothetical protein [Oceanicola sp. S124]|uniref:hypothetical protein n=1 Tax=Oceanicola sp. S124 TaxID=1042378 RepID=UPI0002559722|nr:hypothetical protein [Oceanicola sp. S124]